jgi:hypothetical protein
VSFYLTGGYISGEGSVTSLQVDICVCLSTTKQASSRVADSTTVTLLILSISQVLPADTQGFTLLSAQVVCTTSVPCSFELQAVDQFGNTVISSAHSYVLVFISQSYPSFSFILSDASTTPYSPPMYIGGGKHRVSFTPELTGFYSIFVTLKLSDSNGQSAYLTADPQNRNMLVNPQVCGSNPSATNGLSSTPYQCPSGQCVASYSNCPGVIVCPTATPFQCGANGACVASAISCPCPNGYTRCRL